VKMHSPKVPEMRVHYDRATDKSKYLHGLLDIKSDGENQDVTGPIMRAFHAMTGDTSRLYGLANLDALSAKRQRTLPVNCTVYDLFNFATEVATHHAGVAAARKLHGMVGTMLTAEYDMEGTKVNMPHFADFHIKTKLENNLSGSELALSN